MKRRLGLILLALFGVLTLTGCECEHDWVAADCDTPKTCAECQETEGAALGHDWLPATCETAKTCKACGAVEGIAAGHSWVEASCMAPRYCEICELEEGEVLDHTWLNATTETPKTCSVCGMTEGDRIMTDERFKTASCSALFGDWRYEMTMSGEELELGGYIEEVPFVAVLTFTEDGRISIDLTFRDMEQFNQDLYAGTVDAIYEQFEDLDMTREEADIAFEDTYGMSVEEYCAELWAAVDWNGVFDLFELDFVYYVEDGALYIAEAWEETFSATNYSINGDTMTLEDADLFGGTVLELTKVQ